MPLVTIVAESKEAAAQEGVAFQLVDQGMAQLNAPVGAFGDVDDDGDLDILVAGKTAVEFPVPITRVYVGLGESQRVPPGGGRPRWFRDFEERGIGISAVWIGAGAWFDPNRDGRLEFVVSGSQNGNPPYVPQAALYRPDGSGFARMSASIPGLYGGSVDVGDFNNDGNDDILLTGSTGETYQTLLYVGTRDGLFVPSSIALPAVGLGEGKFGDYDRDGDLDIILVGDSDAGLAIHLLRNEGGTGFTEVPTSIAPVVFPTADWGDYDADGDLDLLLAGARLSPVLAEGQTRVYRNDGDGLFTDIDAGIEGTYHGFARWGDFNDDGRIDIVEAGGSGVTQLDRSGKIYLNDGGDQFRFVANITELTVSAGDVGDYDGDGDLDIIQLGQGAVALYRNEKYVFDTPPGVPEGKPTAPDGLSSVVDGTTVTLSWDVGADDQTPEEGLSYNIRVGTVPGSVDVVSPLAHPSNGKRKVYRLGNVQNNRIWQLRGLPSGTYYWSVQTLDSSFNGSDFAGDRTFSIP